MRTLGIELVGGAWSVREGASTLRTFARQADARRFAEEFALSSGEAFQIHVDGGLGEPDFTYRVAPRPR